MSISLSGSLLLTGSIVASGNLTTTGTITAQTLVVQTITSSIVNITGSNIFGSQLSDRQTFTGSVVMTGSLTVNTAGTEFQVNNTGINFGNALTDTHNISGSLRITGSGNHYIMGCNLGIGTTNPDRLLQISNTSGQAVFSIIGATNDAADIFLGDNDNKAEAVIRFINGANTFNILQGGATRMTIASSGSVGIGTNTPSAPLHINCSTTQLIRITSAASLPSGFADAFQMLFSNQTGGAVSLNIGKAESQNNLGKMAYFHCADGSASNRLGFGFFNNDNLFNVLASGNVGIGCASPSYILDIRDSNTSGVRGIRVSSASNTVGPGIFLNVTSGNNTNWAIGNSYYIGSALEFIASNSLGGDPGTAGTARLLITCAGYTYINTTTNPLAPDNATPQLGILAGAGTDAVNIKHTVNGNNTVNIWQTGASQYSAIAFYKGDVQTNRGLIVVNTSGTTYTSVSDYRLKENITPLENGLDRVLQLKPSKFNWIESGEEAEGFIAHELQEYFPYAVTGQKDGMYSSTGNMKLQSVDYGRITPLLVKAIQEQQCTINTLKTCIGIA